MSVRVAESQPEIAGYELSGANTSLGIRYMTHLAVGGSGVELTLSEAGLNALQTNDQLFWLANQLSERFAHNTHLQLDELDETFASLGLTSANPEYVEVSEAAVYRASDSPNGLIVKGYFGPGAPLQFRYMNWAARTLESTTPDDGSEYLAPRQHLALVTPSGAGILIMENIPGATVDDIRFEAEEAEDPARLAEVHAFIRRTNSGIHQALGRLGAAVAFDLGRTGNNLILAGQHDINADLNGPQRVAMIDQPSTGSAKRLAMATAAFNELQASLESSRV